MVRKLMFLVLIMLQALTCGCPVVLMGAGAGVGAYTYVRGELDRTYSTDFQTALQAATETLKHLKIQISQKESDGIQTRLSAKRPDGTPVLVKVTMKAPQVTAVSVRTGAVGYWDRDVSELIHATIAQKL